MAIAYDHIVIGAGSAGCAVAHGLVTGGAGSVLVIEAGPSDRWPLVRMPFGLVWMMGGRRDWRYRSAPQAGLGGRSIAIPRGRMVGGSGSINSMVWFRGRAADFDGWAVPGWSWPEVAPAFDAVEAHLRPRRLSGAHPLTEALGALFPTNDPAALPHPDREGAGVFAFNLHDGRRWSAADAFLRPVLDRGATLLTGAEVARLTIRGDRIAGVRLGDGTEIAARKGVVLSAGAIGSPEILLRSGFGPAEDLRAANIDVIRDLPGIGQNLHDHPGAGLHYEGGGSGYGLAPSLWPRWAMAPLQWAVTGRGLFASPTVEGGGFFNARGDGGEPDVQSHFIPFRLGHDGRRYALKQGYFADVCLCRPKSRGALRLTKRGLEIDLGLFADEGDLDTLTAGWLRLRARMVEADLGPHQAPEVAPGPAVQTEDQARAHIRATAGTAYHPVGTLRMGADDAAPVTPELRLRGIDGLHVADASVMPAVTSANTNAPAMMIGYRAGMMISRAA
jgi:choline dehydrogenase